MTRVLARALLMQPRARAWADPRLMRAAIYSEHGGPEVIRIAELPDPEPAPGEVRIRVACTSLNHLDLWLRRGTPAPTPMPHVGGADIAGVVDRVGSGVHGVRPGTRVAVDPALDWEWYRVGPSGDALPNPRFRVVGEHTQGGLAEYAVVPAANLLQLPGHVPMEVAAAAGLVYVTAWRALVTRGRLRPGERVLVTGGSGGVATAGVQIAAATGATVFAVTSGSENVARLAELGADVVVDREGGPLGSLLREATGARRVDLVLDSVGEAIWTDLIKALGVGGRLVTYGATTGPSAPARSPPRLLEAALGPRQHHGQSRRIPGGHGDGLLRPPRAGGRPRPSP